MPRSSIAVAVNCRRRKGGTGQEREWGRQKDPAQQKGRDFPEWKSRWDSWSGQVREDPNVIPSSQMG